MRREAHAGFGGRAGETDRRKRRHRAPRPTPTTSATTTAPGPSRCWPRGITTTGAPVLLALDGASSESHDACVDFLRGLVARGLRPPLLVISDGAPGLIGAVDRV